MLKKLRIKFILFNMVIVTIMLAVIFSLLYYTTSMDLERTSVQTLERLSETPEFGGPPEMEPRDIHLPYFSITLTEEEEISKISGDYYDSFDAATISAILDQIKGSDGDSGVLNDYNIRYIKRDTPDGSMISCMDITIEKNTLRKLIQGIAIVGILAFLVFLGLSFLLSSLAVRPVERAWKQQKQFVADASHELKTPLTVIMTDAELINSPTCSEDDRVQLSSGIITMTEQMRGLVESMLELARVDSGQVQTPKTILSLSDTVSKSAMVFEPVMFERDLIFSYDIEPQINMTGNEAQLKQLVEILLDNAAKYASPGGEVTLALKGTQNKRCRLTVSNQGEPISSEDLSNLFKRFYRVDKSRKMNHSYGLGLSIAESITQTHGGKIWAESKDGVNSFFVELPVS